MDSNTPVPSYSQVQVETYDRPATAATLNPTPLEERTRRRRPRWVVWTMGCMLGVLLLALLSCALISGLVMGIALKLANEVTASTTATQSFAVSDTPSLDIHNAAGWVRVQPGANGTVTVTITKTARDVSQNTAQANLNKITVNMVQTGNHISITSDFQDESYFASSNTVNLLITVPLSTNIAADVTAGNIEINGVTGLIEITGGASNVSVRNVVLTDGSRIHIATGSATLQGVVPADVTVDISVSTGAVTLQLPADTQTRLDARTNIGDIHINGWPLQPTHLNRVGAMANGALGAQPTGTVRIRVDTGDITVSQL